MSVDNTTFQERFRLYGQQRAERDPYNTSPIPSVATNSFDGPAERRARPRHHFRRGAISEASGQPILTIFDGERPGTQHEIQITSRTLNEIEIIIRASSGQQQPANNPPYQTDLRRWRELVGRMRRGLVNIDSPAFQHRINARPATWQRLTSAVRNQPSMENNSDTDHHDIYRYGRDGWWTVQNEPDAPQRPATVPGSRFAVPCSTLNLFQSVDLFASPPTRPTASDVEWEVYQHLETYLEHLEVLFSNTINQRRRGLDVPSGKLFTISMELSRVRELLFVWDDERSGAQRGAGEEAAERARTLYSNHEYGEASSSEDFSNWHAADGAPDDDPSDSEDDEPDRWANLDVVLDDDYCQEVCFRFGSEQLTFSIQDVEDWMMDERRRERWALATARIGRRPSCYPDDYRRTHLLAMPPTVNSTWRHHSYVNFEYQSEADGGDNDEEGEQSRPYNDEESDIPDTEYEEQEDGDSDVENEDDEDNDVENEDDEEGEVDVNRNLGSNENRYQTYYNEEDVDGEDGSGHGSEDWQEADRSRTVAYPQVPPTYGTASPTANTAVASQSRPQNTGVESNATGLTTVGAGYDYQTHAPHPVQGWAFDHSLFMFSCRGSIFDVTRQLQHAFGFEPSLPPHLVGERLNGETAGQHRAFISTFLPGEVGINLRASSRDFLHQRHLANDDVYHGTQDIQEGDVESEGYARPPLPGRAPDSWNGWLDICLLQALNRGHINLVSFWHRHQDLLGYIPLSAELRGFLSIRLAQVRYLGVTEVEQSASQERGSGGEIW